MKLYQAYIVGGKQAAMAITGHSGPPALVDLFDFRNDVPGVEGDLVLFGSRVVVKRLRANSVITYRPAKGWF